MTTPDQTPGASMAESLGPVIVGTRHDLVVTRQMTRGEPRYILHDPVAFASHSLNVLEYRIYCALGSRRTLSEVFNQLCTHGAIDPEDRDEFYEFVLGLHGMGLLVVPGMPTDSAWRRREERERAKRKSKLRSLISLRIPIGNPDDWLTRIAPYGRWLFQRSGFALWVTLMFVAIWQCGDRLGALYGNAANLLALDNLLITWCSLVGLKAIHELGHALAIKRYGGVVPECGVLFMFMTPCAYVDANASWTFSSRWHRIVVGMGGMYVESMIAFVAAIVWAGTQPGLLHDTAQGIVVLATITTVLINSNPLIKFDGYYVFSDLLGIFNLQERATRSFRSGAERLFLGIRTPSEPMALMERLVVWSYAPASLVYRISLAFSITMIMLSTWPTIGVPLGLAFAWMLILDPVRRLFRYLWSSERLEEARLRGRVVAISSVLLLAAIATLIPIRDSVVVPAILDPGVKRSIRAPSSGFIEELSIADGATVQAGTTLCRLRDPVLEDRLVHVANELEIAKVQFDVSELTEPELASTLKSRIDFLEERYAELESRAAALRVTLPSDTPEGTVIGARQVRPGQFIRQGDEILRVHSEHRFVRVVLNDWQLAQARLQIGTEAQVRWRAQPSQTVRAVVCEIRRSASRNRVPAELTMAAGGQIYARTTEHGVEADQPYLHVFLRAESAPLGSRGSGLTGRVRFNARQENLGGWMKRNFLTFLYNWRAG